MGLRSAEKTGRRTSSCPFADTLAALSIAAYHAARASLPEPPGAACGGQEPQTVLAAIVACDVGVGGGRGGGGGEGQGRHAGEREEGDAAAGGSHLLRVVALGAGTKFMAASAIDADAEVGERVRDCHAEVLARRALKRFLYAQIRVASARYIADDLAARGGDGGGDGGNACSRQRQPKPDQRHRGYDDRDHDGDGASLFNATPCTAAAEGDPRPWCILEPCGSCDDDGGDDVGNGDDNSGDNRQQQHHRQPKARQPRRWRVRPSVTLHLYTSSTPCGNACIKRWARGAQETFRPDLGPMQTPPGAEDHGKVSFGAAREGQLAFMYKRDAGLNSVSRDLGGGGGGGSGSGVGGSGSGIEVHNGGASVLSETGSLSSAAAAAVATVIPPGSCTTGRLLTCSDKLAVWSCVGLQGALLLSPHLLAAPVHLASVTVGRKFNQSILRRALCCRLHRFTAPQNPAEAAARAAAGLAATRGVAEAGAATSRVATEGMAAAAAAGAARAAPCPPRCSVLARTVFTLKHPAIMCTATPFDLGTYADGEGARFDSPTALVWWADEDGGDGGWRSSGGSGEIINGRTGAGVGAGAGELYAPYSGEVDGSCSGSGSNSSSGGGGGSGECGSGASVSGVSRATLLRVHRSVLAAAQLTPPSAAAASADVCGDDGESRSDGAWAYAALKLAAGAASGYSAAKQAALSQPGLWHLSTPHITLPAVCAAPGRITPAGSVDAEPGELLTSGGAGVGAGARPSLTQELLNAHLYS